MAARNRVTNKPNFATGKTPTGTQFADLIDSFYSFLDDNTDSITEGTANLFLTAALKSKLEGIEAGATADQTGSEIATLLFALADTNNLTDALLTKLNGIEEGATASTGSGSMTNAEVKTAYEANADTNALTDALLTKLNALLTAAQLPAGGTSGQFLKKGAGGDYDADFDTIVINDIDQLQTSLDAKAPSSHQHGSGDLTDLEFIYLQTPADDAIIAAIGSATWTDNVATVTGFEQGRKYSDANYLYEAIADNTALRQKKAETESTITVSTSDPSGGADGDIWFKVSA